MIKIKQGAEHPVTEFTWTDNGQLLDLSQGFNFEVKVVSARNVRQQITKTTNIRGYRNIRPNVKIEWQPTGELSTLSPGWYSFQIKATNVKDSTERIHTDSLLIEPAL